MSRLLHCFSRHGCRSVITEVLTSPRYYRMMSTGFSSSKLDLTFKDDGTALVSMKSGDNRFHPETIDEWHEVLDHIEKNPKCGAVVTTGQDKFYSNGLDFNHIKTFTNQPRQLYGYVDKFNRLLMRLLVFPLPTVAAINGHAFAGGALWALAHDMRVMNGDKGWVCINEILFDGRFPPIHMEMMKAKMTSAQVQTQVILFAKRFTAAEALNSGIVDKVANQSQLVAEAQQLANQVLGKDGINRDNLTCFKKDLYHNVLMAHRMPDDKLKHLVLK